MFDGMKSPGRNDECWCGSGKKYKKCHLNLDERLQELYEQGEEVPHRSLLKTAADIEGIKKSAAINIGVLDYVSEHIKAGVSTAEIDKWIYDYTIEHGGTPADLNFEGYPNSVCTSINEVVCHGIPSEDDVLKEGDIVNVDCSTILDGYFSDSCRMFCIGEVSEEAKQLVQVSKECVELGLKEVKPWGFLGDIAQAVSDHAHKNGYTVVREIGGHGVGLAFHEDPWVGYVGRRGTDMLLVPGMVFTIEPMINQGSYHVKLDSHADTAAGQDWIVITSDGKLSSQWEITVAVTEDGAEVLTY